MRVNIPKEQLDHKDRNKLNNRMDNLRYASHSEQMINRDYGRSGMKGITQVYNRFEVRVSIEGKLNYVGAYPTLHEAQKAFQDARGV